MSLSSVWCLFQAFTKLYIQNVAIPKVGAGICASESQAGIVEPLCDPWNCWALKRSCKKKSNGASKVIGGQERRRGEI